MAEAPPTTRVRMEMWKSLCCRPTKVNDQPVAHPPENGEVPAEKRVEVQLTVTKQPGSKEEEVVLFVSPQLLARGLLGKIVKSAPSMVLSVKGDDAIRRVAESCTDIGKQYALTRLDLIWSTSAKEAKKDLQLMFPPKGQFVIPPSPIAVSQPDEPQPELDSTEAAQSAMDDPAQEVSIEEPKESPKEPAPA
ncbi:hypothetical protein PRIPAC_84313 [Pristionchus pacificus]|uniref:Uncharacterized protein n=1 Tax=Pristionchus pacificus TaxID=54126 RepID=A0A2A6BTM3_PRIPA|nr:hypothetical protein PRIPAC_84313 [Pristionchus pacificus]|eukprot:PDM69153.1 hypothetical protein PRIPAC_47455 [Pristionchus pacificus]